MLITDTGGTVKVELLPLALAPPTSRTCTDRE
jgi:hypothetical protein